MAGRGFAAVLVIAAALVPLIASGGAGAQSGDSVDCPGATTIVDEDETQTCVFTVTPAKCVQKSSSPEVVQTCTITQSGTKNEAYVLQVNNSDEQGTTQDATQTTTINQGGGDNKATVKQDIKQTTHESGPTTQMQDGHQITIICQGGSPCTAVNGGTNTANVTQSRWADAHASGGTITQLQDTVVGTDCFSGSPTEPNVCANLTQNSTVKNDAALHQDVHLLAEASGNGTITQTQGSGDGGIDGHVMQQIATGTPQNTEDAHQHLTYDLSAPDTATQTQDPRIGGGTPGGKLNLHQVGILRASATTAVQHLGIDGLCVSNDDCLILQHGKINNANFTTRCQAEATAELPASCTANIECVSAGEIDSNPAMCTGFPEKGNPPDLTSLGFDTLDFQDAINFTFPVSLPGL